MARSRKKSKKNFSIYKIVVVLVLLLAILFVLKIAPDYIRNNLEGKVSLIINNNDVTKNLKNDVIIRNDTVYISKKDTENYFDGEVYYDSKYNQIITSSDTKLATLPVESKKIEINGATIDIYAGVIKENDEYYLPFSEISKSVFNMETSYIEETNAVVIVSLDRKLVLANSSKKNSVKYKPTSFSKTVDKINRGDTVTLAKLESDDNSDWTRVLTENGKIGYVKTKNLANEQVMRDDLELEKQIDGNVSIMWDYFYNSAPSRSGKIEGINVVSPTFVSLKRLGQGDIETKIGTSGENYTNWAHENGYKVWALVSNESMKDTTSEIVNDYNLRKRFIDNIVNLTIQYDFDGINLDFENIYKKDKDAYSRLIIELAPRLRDLGKTLSVDVTAPDGSDDWSLCFDRNIIAKVADYIVFMAYDQHGTSSENPGTVAGYDWVEKNINKFLEQEEVDANKIILGMPFYTRIWKVSGATFDSTVVNMNETYSNIPANASITWLEDEKQNYAEYIANNSTYKVWIEDVKSLEEKLNLIDQYELAGGAYWRKDMETDGVWNLIAQKLSIK